MNALQRALPCVVAAASFVAAQAPPAPDRLLLHAGLYVLDFTARFSSVVAEEDYWQIVQPDTSSGRNIPMQRRRLKSDFLLVKVPSDESWLPFRDVFEVDGRPVRDRQDRLTKLFLQPAATAHEQAAAIVAESARYNLGTVRRNINVPVIALDVLRPENQRRFRFSPAQEARKVGPDVWSIDYEEETRPTLIHGRGRADMPARGRLWVETTTGRVVKSEITVEDDNVRATITTDYRFDPAFGVRVPVEMHEIYVRPRVPAITGTAVYSRFRRFSVSTDETIKKDTPDLRRVIRGGSWSFDANSTRCALRYTHAPGDRGFSLGFRVAADPR